jgi:hypothetical protein
MMKKYDIAATPPRCAERQENDTAEDKTIVADAPVELNSAAT